MWGTHVAVTSSAWFGSKIKWENSIFGWVEKDREMMSHVVMLGLEVMNIDDSLILAVEDK